MWCQVVVVEIKFRLLNNLNRHWYDFNRDLTNEILNINVIFENMTHRSLPSCLEERCHLNLAKNVIKKHCFANTVNNYGTKSALSR